MSQLPVKLYRAEQVRELDRIAIEEMGISGLTLMEQAGFTAFAAMIKNWPRARTIAVLCGVGNNGGDGYVVARLAHEKGLAVRVFTVGSVNRLKGDARTMAEKLPSVAVTEFSDDDLSQYDVVVDGLLGTGIKGAVKGEWASAINAVNHAQSMQSKVLALDIPSGLCANSGSVETIAVMADMTVSFIGLKQGLFTADGPAHVGNLIFADLNVPNAVYEKLQAPAEKITFRNFQQYLEPRQKNSYKGDYGHVLVIGGNQGYVGAARLAAEGALRSGAGLVGIATRENHVLTMIQYRPEMMCNGTETREQLLSLLDQADVAVIGPGLGQDNWARLQLSTLLDTLLGALSDSLLDKAMPSVIDADALNLLALEPSHSEHWVLTPHPGEAARLLATTPQKIQQDRFAAIIALQKKYGGVIILKGCGTLVYDGQKPIQVCTSGNAGMASGGMGDVLAGMVGSFIGQGLSNSQAAVAAVEIHAMAGDLAARQGGERGLLATDLMPYIRQLANS